MVNGLSFQNLDHSRVHPGPRCHHELPNILSAGKGRTPVYSEAGLADSPPCLLYDTLRHRDERE